MFLTGSAGASKKERKIFYSSRFARRTCRGSVSDSEALSLREIEGLRDATVVGGRGRDGIVFFISTFPLLSIETERILALLGILFVFMNH